MANILQAGESVPFSGVTGPSIRGSTVRRITSWLDAERLFLGCSRCSDQVKFLLALSAVHVVTHPFFHSEQRVTIGEEYSW
jgi:hypothetical protein